MPADNFYDINPVAVIDQNHWTPQLEEVMWLYRESPVIYTPLVDYDTEAMQTGAETTIRTELMPGDVDIEEIPLTANYINAYLAVDSRSRRLTQRRYGDKVQLHSSENIYQQWRMSGGRDWRPLLRGILGNSVIVKNEMLARNAFLTGPTSRWTFADGGGHPTNFNEITSADTFQIDIVKKWNLRLGATGNPVVPGSDAGAKLAVVPPGVKYDFLSSLAAATASEAQMYRDTMIYRGDHLKYEFGSYMGVRFQEHPNDMYGDNRSVLYNCGAIVKQFGVTLPISIGDGTPDPETTPVEGTYYVGQKSVRHYVQLEDFANADFAEGDIVTISYYTTARYGVTNGVDPLAPKTIQRRVVGVDHVNNRLSFNRSISFEYKDAFHGTSVSGAAGDFYAYVTKARNIGMIVAMGGRGAIRASIAKPLSFYEPEAKDDFKSVWRFVWDEHMGFNVWEPELFEVHFCALTLPKPGGLILP